MTRVEWVGRTQFGPQWRWGRIVDANGVASYYVCTIETCDGGLVMYDFRDQEGRWVGLQPFPPDMDTSRNNRDVLEAYVEAVWRMSR